MSNGAWLLLGVVTAGVVGATFLLARRKAQQPDAGGVSEQWLAEQRIAVDDPYR